MDANIEPAPSFSYDEWLESVRGEIEALITAPHNTREGQILALLNLAYPHGLMARELAEVLHTCVVTIRADLHRLKRDGKVQVRRAPRQRLDDTVAQAPVYTVVRDGHATDPREAAR